MPCLSKRSSNIVEIFIFKKEDTKKSHNENKINSTTKSNNTLETTNNLFNSNITSKNKDKKNIESIALNLGKYEEKNNKYFSENFLSKFHRSKEYNSTILKSITKSQNEKLVKLDYSNFDCIQKSKLDCGKKDNNKENIKSSINDINLKNVNKCVIKVDLKRQLENNNKMISVLDSEGYSYIRKSNSSTKNRPNKLSDKTETILRNQSLNFDISSHGNKNNKNEKSYESNLRNSKKINFDNNSSNENESLIKTKILDLNKDYYDCSFVRIKKETLKK